MAFNLTRFIYPLESKIQLSKIFNLDLDNPRTDDEISFVQNSLKRALQIENPAIDDIEKQLFSKAARGFIELKEHLKINDSESYAYKFIDSLKNEEMIQIIAKTWIILRFPDNNLFEDNIQDTFKLLNKIYKQDGEKYILNFDNSLNYSYILSLLINDEEKYRGFSFLLFNSPIELFYPTDRYKVYRTIENFRGSNFLLKEENRATDWTYWLDIKETIIDFAQKLEVIISQTEKIKPTGNKKVPISKQESSQEKLLYIGSILKTVDHETKNIKLKLLLLTSIIEYLVTKNPDTSRFNVEDSISKQFKLKSAILIYLNSVNENLDNIKNSLDNIYTQRSNVAHGNYNSKKDNSDYLKSVFNLYDYIKAMILAYIKDKNFVDYLKDN